MSHLIILPFEVFSLFSFFFSCIWEGEMSILPICICMDWTALDSTEREASSSYVCSPRSLRSLPTAARVTAAYRPTTSHCRPPASH